jgi:hypothetical protein
VKTEKREHTALECMCCRIDGSLFKEDTISSYRCTDTAIENISFKGVNGMLSYREEDLLLSELIGPY